MDTKIKKEQMVKVFLLEEIKRLTKVDDKLEQRIATLEKSVGRIHSILVQVNAIKEKNDID